MDNTEDQQTTPGIIYLSRIPPFMKPLKIRNLFSEYGEVGRLFLQPEDSRVRKNRKKSGGSGRKQFTEGWIEFKDKKVAKAIARTLNNTNIGGKKRYYYYDDIWNVKYLPKFKWGHISEKLAYEKAVREQRMRAEISQAKKEANFYLENVGKGKALEAIEKRRRQKRKLEDHKETDTSIEKKTARFHEMPKSRSCEAKTHGVSTSLLSKIFTNG